MDKLKNSFREEDYRFMRRAIALAKEGKAIEGGGPFGAVVVRDGTIIAGCYNTVNGKKDCTQHAELAVIRQACRNLKSKTLEDCTLYTSCEPCMMCLGACHWAKFKAIYFGASAKDAKEYGFIYSSMYYESDSYKRRTAFNMKKLLSEEAIAIWQ